MNVRAQTIGWARGTGFALMLAVMQATAGAQGTLRYYQFDPPIHYAGFPGYDFRQIDMNLDGTPEHSHLCWSSARAVHLGVVERRRDSILVAWARETRGLKEVERNERAPPPRSLSSACPFLRPFGVVSDFGLRISYTSGLVTCGHRSRHPRHPLPQLRRSRSRITAPAGFPPRRSSPPAPPVAWPASVPRVFRQRAVRIHLAGPWGHRGRLFHLPGVGRGNNAQHQRKNQNVPLFEHSLGSDFTALNS